MGNRLFRAKVSCGLALVLCAITMACGGKNKGGDKGSGTVIGGSGSRTLKVPRVDPKLCSTKGKKVQTFDLNHDNKPDVWKLYASSEEGGTRVEVLTCKQIDYDHDGVKDYVATYRRTGELVAEDFDFTFDGRFDAREHYDKKTGKIYLVERDSDHDKQPDIWEKYTKEGVLESIRRDRNADGKPDVWEQYDNGQLVAILYDDDFDNRVDRKEQAVPQRPSETPTSPGPGGDADAPAIDGDKPETGDEPEDPSDDEPATP